MQTSTTLKLLGVEFDSKLTFERHVRNVTAAIAQKIGLLRKCKYTFSNDETVLKTFLLFYFLFFSIVRRFGLLLLMCI